ncbi:unnamed protein product [Lymnaea stagnalis]|uniref:Rho-GAP domain-containing protein n=1 Tax=Lymnaea stagnalis TaxID=6523 RepID=A0AAV2HW43_LYMST
MFDCLDIKAVRSLPVITVSNVLKMVIRELAPPLIGEDSVKELLGANALTTESEKFTRMKSVLQLDSTKYNCLTAILLHLRRIAENSKVNLMTVENLAVVFSPSLLPTTSSFQHLEPLDAIRAAAEENNVKCQVIALLIKAV